MKLICLLFSIDLLYNLVRMLMKPEMSHSIVSACKLLRKRLDYSPTKNLRMMFSVERPSPKWTREWLPMTEGERVEMS